MKKIRLFALVMLGLMTSVVFAQNLKVTGIVTSEEDGQPLPGAIVTVKGTTQGAGTVADGSYTLNNVPANAILEFRYTGMKTQEVSVGGKSKIDVVMKADALQAEEAVVTALGVRKQDRKLGYSVSTVGGDDLSRASQTNVVAALQGKVAGVQVNTSTVSGVTSTSNITIRGAKSLTKSAQPIFVVDGIILENAEGSIGSNGTTDATTWGNQIKDLNPDDFESVTVLKGAAATSLYGSRGANGAVVINTKKGKARKGIGLEVSYSHTFTQTYQGPFSENTLYGLGDWYGTNTEGNYNEAWQSTIDGYFDWSYGPKFSDMKGQKMKLWYNGDDTLSDYVYHNNYSAFYRNASADNVSASLTGGSDKVTYRLGYGYNSNKGVYAKNQFTRHTIDFSTTGQINDVLSVDFSLKYANSTTDNAYSFSGWDVSTSPAMMLGYYGSPTADAAWVKENWYDHETYEVFSDIGISTWRSYFAKQLNENVSRNEESIISRVQLNAKFTDYLDASASLSYNHYNYFTETKNWGTGVGRANGGKYAISSSTNGNYDGMAQVHFNKRFINDNFEVDARVMGEIYGNTRTYSSSKSTNGGLIAPGVFNFANSKNALTTSNLSKDYTKRNQMTVGLAAIVNLSWKDQINLELTGRNDWLSSLLYPSFLPAGADNWSVFYPSANLSWVFSDTFNMDPGVVSYGKLRASIAQVGMGTSAYATSAGAGGYNQGNTNLPGAAGASTTVIYANPNNSTLPNLNLKPEIQQSIEFGADVRFLNDRIGLDVTYYKSNTYNQILSLTAPSESGVTNRWINAGNIQNQGWEIQIDATPIRTRNFRWNISANWTRNRGKLKELHSEVKSYRFMGYVDPAVPEVWAFEGGEYGVMVAGNGYSSWSNPTAYQRDPSKPGYGKAYIGYGNLGGTKCAYYLNTGSFSDYYDEDYQYTTIGNVQPDYYWGANTTLSFKGFDLFVQVDGRKGGMVSTPLIRYMNSQGNTTESLLGRDAEHGGVARTNYKGEQQCNGLILDGVFTEGQKFTSITDGQEYDVSYMTMQEVVDAGIIEPAYYGSTNYYNNRWACNTDIGVQELTYISLREITLGYNFPEKWIRHLGLNSARLQLSCRNVCYLQNNLRLNMNPESLTNMNVMTPYDMCGAPFTRSYYLTLNLRF